MLRIRCLSESMNAHYKSNDAHHTFFQIWRQSISESLRLMLNVRGIKLAILNSYGKMKVQKVPIIFRRSVFLHNCWARIEEKRSQLNSFPFLNVFDRYWDSVKFLWIRFSNITKSLIYLCSFSDSKHVFKFFFLPVFMPVQIIINRLKTPNRTRCM